MSLPRTVDTSHPNLLIDGLYSLYCFLTILEITVCLVGNYYYQAGYVW
jgi:hypothetical protein